ncbi:MAG: Gfo/Idh/MocA family oxidoreductase [Hyphomicrobiaceae bacterium]
MPVKLGFIGFGIMGERLLRAALNHDKAAIAITGIYDLSPAATERLRAIDPGLVCYPTAAAVIAASDVLHIASPPRSHLAYLDECANAGKAALCEKPLATDVDAATAAVASLKARGARVGVNFPFASSFAVDQIKTWMRDGVVGTPQRIDIELAFANWPRSWQMDAVSWLDARPEGGFTREVGSHFLFLSRRLFGPLLLANAICRYPETGRSERAIDAGLTAGELPVHLAGNIGATSKDDHNTWTLSGTEGRIRLRDWSIAEREVDGEWQAPADALPNEKIRPLVLARQLDKVAALTRGEATTLATLDEALDVQRVVEAILQAEIA